ncbi:MAG: hypothetical protein R6U85_12240 [Salinivirgaceae bacterium]
MEAHIHALETEQARRLDAQQDAAFYQLPPEEIARSQNRLAQLTEEIEDCMERWAELEDIQAGRS